MEGTASRETLKVDDRSDPGSRGIKRSASLSIDVCETQCKEDKDETGPICAKRQSSTSVSSQQNKSRLRKVAYVWSEEMGEVCDLLPRVPQRVCNLINIDEITNTICIKIYSSYSNTPNFCRCFLIDMI